MYENEFNGALQAIAESVTESDFDAIVEGAAILLEENEGMRMDEAVQASAAMLYNEDAIGDDSFAVTDAVIDEFASNVPASWDQALAVIAESVDEDTFDALMNEAVVGMVKALTEAGQFKGDLKKLGNAADNAYGKGRDAVAAGAKKLASGAAKVNPVTNIKSGTAMLKGAKAIKDSDPDYAKDLRKEGGKQVMVGAGKALAPVVVAAGAVGAKKAIDAAKAKRAAKAEAEAAEQAKLSNKVKAKLEEGKEKAAEAVDKAKAKLAPKNESASEMLSLKDLRTLAEQ